MEIYLIEQSARVKNDSGYSEYGEPKGSPIYYTMIHKAMTSEDLAWNYIKNYTFIDNSMVNPNDTFTVLDDILNEELSYRMINCKSFKIDELHIFKVVPIELEESE